MMPTEWIAARRAELEAATQGTPTHRVHSMTDGAVVSELFVGEHCLRSHLVGTVGLADDRFHFMARSTYGAMLDVIEALAAVHPYFATAQSLEWGKLEEALAALTETKP